MLNISIGELFIIEQKKQSKTYQIHVKYLMESEAPGKNK